MPTQDGHVLDLVEDVHAEAPVDVGTSVAVLVACQVALSCPAIVVDRWVEFADLFLGTSLSPFGSVLALIALTWCIGRARALEEIGRNSRLPVNRFLVAWLKYVIPIAITATLVFGWHEYLTQS